MLVQFYPSSNLILELMEAHHKVMIPFTEGPDLNFFQNLFGDAGLRKVKELTSCVQLTSKFVQSHNVVIRPLLISHAKKFFQKIIRSSVIFEM